MTQVQYGRPQGPYGQPYAHAQQVHANFDTNRSLTKYILLGFITLGIYQIWVTARGGEDLNAIASRWDNKRSMNFWLVVFLIGPITLGIAYLVWWHKTSDRIGNEQRRRGLPQTVSAGSYWGWAILGSLIVVGPFIFYHKWLHAMNDICGHYNVNG